MSINWNYIPIAVGTVLELKIDGEGGFLEAVVSMKTVANLPESDSLIFIGESKNEGKVLYLFILDDVGNLRLCLQDPDTKEVQWRCLEEHEVKVFRRMA